jgi:probable HAF family extracellular repeat protein
MKYRLLTTLGLSSVAALMMPMQLAAQGHNPRHPHYTVVDLGPMKDTAFSQATFVANNSLVTGLTSTPDFTQHAVVWYRGLIADLSTPGLGGPNSGAFGVNERVQVDGQAESSTRDANNENFCGYGTGLDCLPFLWEDGIMTALPLLGGNNGTVGIINNRGEVAGIAETGIRDPQCPSRVAINGTGPQVLDFEAVVWGPGRGQIRQPSRLPGDSVGMALGINDKGQVVGSSGSCANTILPPFAAAPHAVLWDRDGSVRDLGNLGGTVNTGLLGVGNVAFAINNRGQVVGVSALPGNQNVHAFLWTDETSMQDLGTLPGDVYSAGFDINERGDVVGGSIDGNPATGNTRAYLWQNGVMTDLNTLVPADSPLYLLVAFAINDVGEIAGFGVSSTGNIHGFLATPSKRSKSDDDRENAQFDEQDVSRQVRKVVLTENGRKQIQKLLRLHLPGDRPLDPQ